MVEDVDADGDDRVEARLRVEARGVARTFTDAMRQDGKDAGKKVDVSKGVIAVRRVGLRGETPLNLELMRLIDEQYLETPWYGARQMARHLRREGYGVGRKRIGRLMRQMGLSSHLSETEHLETASAAQDISVSAARMTNRPTQQVWCAISATFRCGAAFSIWWPSWTGQP